jgi:hypothetical protein
MTDAHSHAAGERRLSRAARLYLVSAGSETEGAVMKVFVAGATGALGSELVPQLVARGHEVVAPSLEDP